MSKINVILVAFACALMTTVNCNLYPGTGADDDGNYTGIFLNFTGYLTGNHIR